MSYPGNQTHQTLCPVQCRIADNDAAIVDAIKLTVATLYPKENNTMRAWDMERIRSNI